MKGQRDKVVKKVFIFIGVSIYFVMAEAQVVWIILPIVDALSLVTYYYIVDMSLALGISKSKQNLTSIKFRGVNIKWGIMEPVLYGFIILAPFGFLKAQIVLVFLLVIAGLGYQACMQYLHLKKKY